MESESKRMKEDDEVEVIIDPETFLSKDVRKILNDTAIHGCKQNILNLGSRLNDNKIGADGAIILFNELAKSTSSISQINVSGNVWINDRCIQSLRNCIESNEKIKGINLERTDISDKGIMNLVPFIEDNTSLKELYLNGCQKITDKSIPYLKRLLSSSAIEILSIKNTSMASADPLAVTRFCKEMKNEPEELNLFEKEINDKHVNEICDALVKYGMKKLKKINLDSNYITSIGAAKLFDTLRVRGSIVTELNLSKNLINDDCMTQLCKYLDQDLYIKDLLIGRNDLTDNGIEILKESLCADGPWRKLDISSCQGITDTSTEALIEIAQDSSITSIVMNDTGISDHKKRSIQTKLAIPTEQRQTKIRSKTKSAAKITALI